MPDSHTPSRGNPVRVLHCEPLGGGKTLKVSVEHSDHAGVVPVSPAMEGETGSAERSRKPKTRPDPREDVLAHRSLYARPETLALIRKIAFEQNVSAQTLYREGLFLMLRRRGFYGDKTLSDV